MLPASAPDLERGVAPLLCAFAATCALARPSGQEEIPHALKPEARGSWWEEIPHAPTPEARGSGREDQPHVQGAVAMRVQEGLEELSHTEGQERWR